MVAVLVGPIIGGGLATLFNSLRAALYFAAFFALLALVLGFVYIVEPKDLYCTPVVFRQEEEGVGREAEAARRDESPSQDQDGNHFVEDPASFTPRFSGHGGESATQAGTQCGTQCGRVWLDPWNAAIGLQTFLTGIAFNGLTSLSALLLLEPKYDVVDLDDPVSKQGQDMSLQVLRKAKVPTLPRFELPLDLQLFLY